MRFMALACALLLIAPVVVAQSAAVPLPALGVGLYLGQFVGGLYENGSNQVPSDHAAEGAYQAALVEPVRDSGQPDSTGKIVLLSVGISNLFQEFCGGTGLPASREPCNPWTFAGQAAADPQTNPAIVYANGACGGCTDEIWLSPRSSAWSTLADTLSKLGVTPAQVQVVVAKFVRRGGVSGLPASTSMPYLVESDAGAILRLLKAKYPNLRQAFLLSRTYAGYSTSGLATEPATYEQGFGIKWTIAAQITQRRTNRVDPIAGSLSLDVAPWIVWGPYLWNPSAPRSDFEADGIHPSNQGEAKVGASLLQFFKTSPLTQPWFLRHSR